MTPPAEALTTLRSALEGAEVRYAISGSWASVAFGEPRFTGRRHRRRLPLQSVERFIGSLPKTFYADLDEARKSIRLGSLLT